MANYTQNTMNEAFTCIRPLIGPIMPIVLPNRHYVAKRLPTSIIGVITTYWPNNANCVAK